MKILMSLAVALGLSVCMTPTKANAQYRGAVRPPAVRPPVPMPKSSAPVVSPKSVTPPASTSQPKNAASVSPQNSVAVPKSAISSSTSTKAPTPTPTNNAGRSGRQQQLRNILNDSSVSRADKGWIKNEIRQIENRNRTSIRVPPGKELAHTRGREAAKGYGYENNSKLNLAKDHRNQHRYDNYGRSNKERPLTPPNPKPTSTSGSSSSLSPKVTGSSSSASTSTTISTPRPSSSSSSPSSAQFTRSKK